MNRKLAELTWREFEKIVPEKIDGVLLPVGTIEAHGCTNLGTDVTIPEFICEKLADELDMLIAPTVPYGITRTLLAYPGSMTVSKESFDSYVADVLVSLFQNSFRKVVVINGHGGHIDSLRNAAMNAWQKTGGKSIVIHWWQICQPVTKNVFGQIGGHAALDETAMVMAAKPELVKHEQCDDIKPFLVRNGGFVCPNPAPLLIYKDGEGAPIFDEKKSSEFADAVVKFLSEYIREIEAGWKTYFG